MRSSGSLRIVKMTRQKMPNDTQPTLLRFRASGDCGDATGASAPGMAGAELSSMPSVVSGPLVMSVIIASGSLLVDHGKRGHRQSRVHVALGISLGVDREV